jgi:hypothetical protein
MTAGTDVRVLGLHVEKTHYGAWIVVHNATGMRVSAVDLRLLRQAEAYMADLGATGVDFTAATGAEIRRDPHLHAYGEVNARWLKRARSGIHDPETGECYSTLVHYGTCGTSPVPGACCARRGRM